MGTPFSLGEAETASSNLQAVATVTGGIVTLPPVSQVTVFQIESQPISASSQKQRSACFEFLDKLLKNGTFKDCTFNFNIK